MIKPYLILSLICTLQLTACTKNHYSYEYVPTNKFTIATITRIIDNTHPLSFFIEGDGYIFNQAGLTNDPTPRGDLARRISFMLKETNMIYLARPCMFNESDLRKLCTQRNWHLGRYSSENIDALISVIKNITRQQKNSNINLYGYSGGGAYAVLIAGKLKDTNINVNKIITIAGNLSLQAMDKHHKSNPLVYSLDPKTYSEQISNIRQVHYVGKNDKVVPPIIAQDYLKSVHNQSNIQIIKVKATHSKGWDKYIKENDIANQL